MTEKVKAGELLNRLTFTNREVAEFAGITESMVKKIRVGSTSGSPQVQSKVQEFVRLKVQSINEKIKSTPLFSVDDV